ncbi:hypothetical protein niasHT_026914 [Heterodera trifolii]|uniref:Uncharacterized protein n=1 Tax=Heterodera trifolii TaxID=157864 RepID=A0ABD2JY88_9BILA
MCSSVSVVVLLAGELLAFAVLVTNAADKIEPPEKVCAPLKDKDKGFYDECMKSEVVKQKGFIPKHLRPPWLALDIFADNRAEKVDSNCYACYKGSMASGGKFDEEEYCACHYENKAPDIKFGKLFGSIKLSDKLDSCVDDFYKVALMPKCGNENYDHIRHCAIVHFYKNDPASEPEGAEFKRTLLLLDGCVSGVKKECKGTVKVEFTEPGTGFFSGNCYEEAKTALENDYHLNIGNDLSGFSEKDANGTINEQADDSTVFTLPVLLQHRKCSGLGSATMDNMFKDITLTISGGDCESKSFKLRDLDASKGRVQEMRGLELRMSDGTAKQWIDDSGSYQYTKKDQLMLKPMENLDKIDGSGKFESPSY